jgi:hypothetical protein
MSKKQGEFVLSFAEASPDEGNRYANDLKSSLLDLDPALNLEFRRERLDSQDFGATLAVVIGTTAANTLARGLAAWLQRNAGARITIRNSTGELVAEGLDSKDVPRIVQALQLLSK